MSFSYGNNDSLRRKNNFPAKVIAKRLDTTAKREQQAWKKREDRLAVLEEFHRRDYMRRRINVSSFGDDILMPIGFGKRR